MKENVAATSFDRVFVDKMKYIIRIFKSIQLIHKTKSKINVK